MENTTTEKLGLTPPKFTTKQRVQWGLASFGGAIISGTYASLLSIFYVDYLGLVGPRKKNSIHALYSAVSWLIFYSCLVCPD
jgi:hypothetical protein